MFRFGLFARKKYKQGVSTSDRNTIDTWEKPSNMSNFTNIVSIVLQCFVVDMSLLVCLEWIYFVQKTSKQFTNIDSVIEVTKTKKQNKKGKQKKQH